MPGCCLRRVLSKSHLLVQGVDIITLRKYGELEFIAKVKKIKFRYFQYSKACQ